VHRQWIQTAWSCGNQTSTDLANAWNHHIVVNFLRSLVSGHWRGIVGWTQWHQSCPLRLSRNCESLSLQREKPAMHQRCADIFHSRKLSREGQIAEVPVQRLLESSQFGILKKAISFILKIVHNQFCHICTQPFL
jgi:hypothetical protein